MNVSSCTFTAPVFIPGQLTWLRNKDTIFLRMVVWNDVISGWCQQGSCLEAQFCLVVTCQSLWAITLDKQIGENRTVGPSGQSPKSLVRGQKTSSFDCSETTQPISAPTNIILLLLIHTTATKKDTTDRSSKRTSQSAPTSAGRHFCICFFFFRKWISDI